jgi:hypothetical protein
MFGIDGRVVTIWLNNGVVDLFAVALVVVLVLLNFVALTVKE